MKPEDHDRNGTPEASGTAAHPGIGTPVPDDPELLLGDALAAQDLLGVGQARSAEDEHTVLERARDSVHRVTAAAAHAGDAGLGRVRQVAERARSGHPVDGEGGWEGAVPPARRSPYLIAVGVTAGALLAWAVLRHRR
ncbi:hypothetical protein AB0K43_22310 [Kitasatospora sp. NPDC049258]|uniref:hypothetical protein n=1 Tax=Kitasatospora sp. NPDC049258 TaxID=3155394 RepID=UPI0034168644